MVTFEKTEYGFLLKLSKKVIASELTPTKHLEQALLSIEKGSTFSVIVDMSEMISIEPQAWERISEGRNLFKKNGMRRTAIISPNKATLEKYDFITKTIDEDKLAKFFIFENDPFCLKSALLWVTTQDA